MPTAPAGSTRNRRREDSPRAWDALAEAKTSDEYCGAWLGLLCARIPHAVGAAVLIESPEMHAFVPIATWPAATQDMGRLGDAVKRALGERRGVAVPASNGAQDEFHFAYPVFSGGRVAAVVAVAANCGETESSAVLRQIHWGSAWLANLFGRRELEDAIRARERVATVLEAVAVALRHGKFRQAVFETANELRQRFACARVAIGLVEHETVKVVALSEAATFEKRTPLVKAYAAAMEEAFDHGGPLAGSAGENRVEARRQSDLLAQSGAIRVLSYPLMQAARCMGVVTLERDGERGFDAEELLWLDAFAALITPVFGQRLAAERHSFERLVGEARWLADRLFGPRHLTWKVAASALCGVALLLALLPVEYRVSAMTAIEGEVQRVAAAPFEGFIGTAFVRAGDTVTAGQPLAQLDDRDLRIEQARWASERDQYDNRLREAMARHDLTAVQVVGAQFRQAEAQWQLATEKIARARVTAPFDGVVVSGDLSQQIGAPVEAGKQLFEIAPLESYRVILQVDERDIRHVRAGQSGQLVITGIAGDPLALTVTKVTPVAAARDGKNLFRVEAKLPQAPERLRPGMEGVGKIEVGKRSLWWVLTHSFTEWLSLALWSWLP
jgi:RND family efflux transporter MFP subunit